MDWVIFALAGALLDAAYYLLVKRYVGDTDAGILAAGVNTVAAALYYRAFRTTDISLAVQIVPYVIAMKRLSILITVVIGGRLFGEGDAGTRAGELF